MKQMFSHLLAVATLATAMLLAGCDTTTSNDLTATAPISVDARAAVDHQDYSAYADLSGDEITASLESAASKQGLFGDIVSVMTRNMYVGTDVDAVIAAEPADVPAAVAQAWTTLSQTDFPGRMKALAREIAFVRPQLVGLQEVTTFRTQTPGDMIFGGVNPATDVEMDFLASLLAELESLGHSYRAVAQIANIDVEMPLIHDPSTGYSTDIRMTDYDVILARKDVQTSNTVEHAYAASFPVFGGSVEIRRGFVAVDAKIHGRTFRFVSTHLEPVETYFGYFQGEQATELLGVLDSETRPLILLGDFNTDAPTGGVYNALVAAGYEDVWTRQAWHPGSGYTCCQDPGLANEVSQLDRRIDLIFVKNFDGGPRFNGQTSTFSMVTGTRPWEKTDTGLWSSDHAGVAAWIISSKR